MINNFLLAVLATGAILSGILVITCKNLLISTFCNVSSLRISSLRITPLFAIVLVGARHYYLMACIFSQLVPFEYLYCSYLIMF